MDPGIRREVEDKFLTQLKEFKYLRVWVMVGFWLVSYGYDLWEVTRRMRLLIHNVQISFCHRVDGLILQDRVEFRV